MSRTIRRKNAWDKSFYVSSKLEDDQLDLYQGSGRYRDSHYGNRGVGKYHGCTEEQILKKRNAWFHRELPDNWSRNSAMKEFSKNYLRSKNEAELIRALARGEEDGLLLTTQRDARGYFVYFD